jgi:hypothetical protein
MMDEAAWQTEPRTVRRQLVTLERGELTLSLRWMVGMFGGSKNRWSNFLRRLEQAGWIETTPIQSDLSKVVPFDDEDEIEDPLEAPSKRGTVLSANSGTALAHPRGTLTTRVKILIYNDASDWNTRERVRTAEQ